MSSLAFTLLVFFLAIVLDVGFVYWRRRQRANRAQAPTNPPAWRARRAKARSPASASVIANVDWRAYVIILSAAAVLTHVYFYVVDYPHLGGRVELHNQILNGTAPSPYQYRVLAPFLSNILLGIFSGILPRDEAFLVAYGIYDFAAITFLLVILFIYLKSWFSREQSLIGVLLVASTLPIALRDHYFQPWSLLEAAFFTTGLLLIYKKRYAPLGFLIVIAALNRETAVFIPLAFLFANLKTMRQSGKGRAAPWKPVILFIVYLGLWGAVFFGLRYWQGDAPHIFTIRDLWSINLSSPNMSKNILNNSLFLGFFWLFVIWGFANAPEFIKKIAPVTLFYLSTVLVWGVWYEVRLLMPLYPILIPLGLSFIYPENKVRRTPAPSTGSGQALSGAEGSESALHLDFTPRDAARGTENPPAHRSAKMETPVQHSKHKFSKTSLAALALGGVGQFAFTQDQSFLGIVAYVIAALLFARAMRPFIPTSPTAEDVQPAKTPAPDDLPEAAPQPGAISFRRYWRYFTIADLLTGSRPHIEKPIEAAPPSDASLPSLTADDPSSVASHPSPPEVATVAAWSSDEFPFAEPQAVVATPHGHVLVIDPGQDMIYRFDPQGKLLGQWSVPGLPQLHAHSLTVSPDGDTLYIADADSRSVKVISLGP